MQFGAGSPPARNPPCVRLLEVLRLKFYPSRTALVWPAALQIGVRRPTTTVAVGSTRKMWQ